MYVNNLAFSTELTATMLALQWIEEVKPCTVTCSDLASVQLTLREDKLGAWSDLVVELLSA